MKGDIMIKTENLTIRPYLFSDCDDLYEILSNKEAVKYELYDTLTYEECKEETMVRAICGEFFAVCLNEKMIGSIYYGNSEYGLELGFIFNPSYWHQGYAYESVKAFVDKVKDKKITARCFRENLASSRLLKRIGFVLINDDDIQTYLLIKN